MGEAPEHRSKVSLPGTIFLATRLGREIPNAQDPDLSPEKTKLYIQVHRRNYPSVVLRRFPTGQYNCFGMVLACRRTGIHEPDMVRLVLEDDGYAQTGIARVQEGDVVMYDDGKEITHLGLILAVETDERLVGGGKALKVLSKWAQGGEYIHWAQECPYAAEGNRITYWTDRNDHMHKPV